jgi:hypothetical protein
MALHLLRGEWTPYYLGQRYLGSLGATLVAPLVWAFGPSVWPLRALPIVAFGAFLWLHARWVRRHWGGRAAALSALLLALPSWLFLFLTHRPTGLTDTLLLGTVLLVLAEPGAGWARLVALGAVVGLGLWVYPLFATYAVAVGAVALFESPEWAAIRSRTGWPTVIGAVGLAALVVLALFSSSCAPDGVLARAVVPARVGLGASALAIGATLVVVSRRRSELAAGAAFVAAGFALGNAAQWGSWLLLGIAPTSAAAPACPDGVPARAATLLGDLLPVTLGLPPPRVALGRMPPLEAGPWLAAFAIAAIALVLFVYAERRSLALLARLEPLAPRDRAVATLVVLLLLPMVLIVLSANAVDGYSARYLLVAWQASAVVLAVGLMRAVSWRRWLGVALVAIWLAQVGGANLAYLGRLWADPAREVGWDDLPALEAHLGSLGATAGYADYWDAYVIDYLSGERLTLVPFTPDDRYAPYRARVGAAPVRAVVLRAGTVPPGIGSAADLVEAMRRIRADVLLTIDPVAEPLRTARVVDHRLVGRWDVWALAP